MPYTGPSPEPGRPGPGQRHGGPGGGRPGGPGPHRKGQGEKKRGEARQRGKRGRRGDAARAPACPSPGGQAGERQGCEAVGTGEAGEDRARRAPSLCLSRPPSGGGGGGGPGPPPAPPPPPPRPCPAGPPPNPPPFFLPRAARGSRATQGLWHTPARPPRTHPCSPKHPQTPQKTQFFKILRERVKTCYKEAGVNHLQDCRAAVDAYLESIKGGAGTALLNAGAPGGGEGK